MGFQVASKKWTFLFSERQKKKGLRIKSHNIGKRPSFCCNAQGIIILESVLLPYMGAYQIALHSLCSAAKICGSPSGQQTATCLQFCLLSSYLLAHLQENASVTCHCDCNWPRRHCVCFPHVLQFSTKKKLIRVSKASFYRAK